MDSKRFDSWTRNRALRLSRRNALKLMGAGGAAAALPAVASDALAQGPCSLTIHGQTDGGPSAGATYDGTLQFSIGSDGALTQATFTQSGGGSQSVTGRAVGRAIDFEVSLGGNQMLTFSGAASQPLSACQGAAAGTLDGPQPGDLGAWQTTGISGGSGSSSSSGGQTSSGSTSGSGSSGSSSSGSGSGSGSGNGGGGGGSTLNCPAPQTACGPNCCPGFGVCLDANQGICACPDGSIQCGFTCVQDCTDENEFLNLDTCQCEMTQEPACIDNGNGCANHGQCCSGYCAGGTCQSCGGKVCGDFGCVDTSRDSQNCGNCGVVCVAPNGLCLGGVCGCIGLGQGGCSFDSDCCNNNCEDGFCQEVIH